MIIKARSFRGYLSITNANKLDSYHYIHFLLTLLRSSIADMIFSKTSYFYWDISSQDIYMIQPDVIHLILNLKGAPLKNGSRIFPNLHI